MADTTALKNRIRAAIKANDNQEITGPVLQQALLDMVDELDLNPELENEADARQSGDSTLQQAINSERQQRQDADTALGQRITNEIGQVLQNNFIFGFDYSKGNISYDSNQHYHQIIDLIETEIISGEFVRNDLNLVFINFNSYIAGVFYIQLRYAKPEDEGAQQSGVLISQVAKSSLKKGEIISLLLTGDSKSVRVTVRISNDFPEGSSFENKWVKVPLCVYRNGYNTYQGITNLRSDIAEVKNDIVEINTELYGDHTEQTQSISFNSTDGADYRFTNLRVGQDYRLTFTADNNLDISLLAITDSTTSTEEETRLYWGDVLPTSVHSLDYHCDHEGAYIAIWTLAPNVRSNGSLNCVLTLNSFDARIKGLEGKANNADARIKGLEDKANNADAGIKGANNAALVALENANVDIRNIKNPFDIRRLLERYVSLNRIVSKVEIISEDFPEDYYFQLSYIWLNTYKSGLGIQVRFSDDPSNFPDTAAQAFTILTNTAIKAGDIIKYDFNIPLIAGATRHFHMVLTMADDFAADAEFKTLNCKIPILIKRSSEYTEIAEINTELYGDPPEQTQSISFNSTDGADYRFTNLRVGQDYRLVFTADNNLNISLLAITDSTTSTEEETHLYWGDVLPTSVHSLDYHCDHEGAYIAIWTIGANVKSNGSLNCVLTTLNSFDARIKGLEGKANNADARIKALEGSNILSAFILPEAIYTVCNDLNKQRQYAVRLYLDHLFNELPDRPNIRNAGATFGVFYSKYTSYVNAINTPEHNKTVDVDKRNNTLVLKADGYQDLTLQIPHISVRNSITKNSKVRLLCIGDSVTAGYLANFNKVNANNPNVYWGYVKMLFEMDKLGDGGASSSNYFFESLGNIVSNTFNIAHDGLSENGVKAYACGVGGTRTTDWLSPTVGRNTNPFYDAANRKFSLQYWVTKYRTLIVNNDGTTTRCDDSNKGELAGDVNAANVCEPTHVLIQLGYNQSYNAEGPTRSTYLSELATMIETIHTEYPTIKIILSLPDTPGTFWPSEWPEFFGDGWDVFSLDFTRGTAKTSHMNFAFMNKDLKALAAEYDYVYYAPTYFATPNCDGAAVRDQKEFCYHASQLKYRQKYFVHDESAPYLHPNNCAHASWAYQIYSLIKYTLTL